MNRIKIAEFVNPHVSSMFASLLQGGNGLMSMPHGMTTMSQFLRRSRRCILPEQTGALTWKSVDDVMRLTLARCSKLTRTQWW